MEGTKIQFSEEESGLMRNQEWILTKNRIIEKMSAAFEKLALSIGGKIPEFYPAIAEDVFRNGYKISKGEKYQGLPYLILDFPRVFRKEEVLAIRVLFWWGNYLSITLQTKGRYAEGLKKQLISSKFKPDDGLYLSCSGDEWNHDLKHYDYVKLKNLSAHELENALMQSSFIKLSASVDLMQWELAEKILQLQYHQFLFLINLSFQYDEKGL